MENKENFYSAVKDLPKVFAIIVNRNGKTSLHKLLAEIFCSDYANLEVVLVDNNSTDGSVEALRGKFPRVTLIRNSEEVGSAAGMNVGIRYALERGAKYVLLLRQEILNLREVLPVLVHEMEKDRQVGLSSPVILQNDNRLLFSGGKINWLKLKLKNKCSPLAKNYLGSSYLLDGAVLVRAEVFRKVGLLNENYFTRYAEVDLSFKARAVGYKLLVCPGVQVRHSVKKEDKRGQEKYWALLSTALFFRYNTPIYLWLWMVVFYSLSFVKNWVAVRIFKKDSVKVMQQVYLDLYRHRSIS